MYKKNVGMSADIIIEREDEIILIKRGNDPFEGKTALPGGILEENETVEQTAVREAKEETGMDVELTEILGVYSEPGRDPRGPTVGIVFIANPMGGELKGGDDAAEAFWINVNEIDFDDLAFDHAKIIEDYIKWKENKGTFWSGK
jgi:8-oxo-dGTP diphosphatase